jgi:1-acyl-sn-glycerol-3-phosphate acyltransferase
MYSFLRIATSLLFRFVVWPFCTPTKVSGLDKLKGLKGPLIIVANHDGRIDPVWISVMIEKIEPQKPKDVRFFVWHKYYDMPILGWYVQNLKSFRLINRQGLQILDPGVDFVNNENGIIGIFPEGKIRKLTEKDKRAKRGVAYLAWKTQAPLLPIYIQYHRRWRNLPFFTLEFAVGDPFTIHQHIQSEDDLQTAADLVLPPIYALANKS